MSAFRLDDLLEFLNFFEIWFKCQILQNYIENFDLSLAILKVLTKIPGKGNKFALKNFPFCLHGYLIFTYLQGPTFPRKSYFI